MFSFRFNGVSDDGARPAIVPWEYCRQFWSTRRRTLTGCARSCSDRLRSTRNRHSTQRHGNGSSLDDSGH